MFRRTNGIGRLNAVKTGWTEAKCAQRQMISNGWLSLTAIVVDSRYHPDVLGLRFNYSPNTIFALPATSGYLLISIIDMSILHPVYQTHPYQPTHTHAYPHAYPTHPYPHPPEGFLLVSVNKKKQQQKNSMRNGIFSRWEVCIIFANNSALT